MLASETPPANVQKPDNPRYGKPNISTTTPKLGQFHPATSAPRNDENTREYASQSRPPVKDRPPVTHSHLSHPALRQAVGLQGCGDVPRVPPTFAARHCLQGCGDVPRVLPVDCTAPLRRLAQAQAQWLPMQLMKVRTPCTRAPLPCECHTCTCERVRTARLTCASAALRGASRGCARSVVNLHVARPVLVNTMTTAFDGSGNAVRRVPPPCDVCAFVAAATHRPQVHLSCGPTTWKRWCMCSCAAS